MCTSHEKKKANLKTFHENRKTVGKCNFKLTEIKMNGERTVKINVNKKN